jgi:hypothetical protein
LFDKLVRESDVKDPLLAKSKPFFYGVKTYSSETDYVGTTLHEPAFTDDKITSRLSDHRFCRFCFMYDEHDYDCRSSGWRVY